MIDFRYHIVSIVAVFLALAIGIVLGSTALERPLRDQLESRAAALSGDNAALRAQKRALELKVAGADDFAEQVSDQLLHGQLDGQRVVLVESPGAPEELRSDLVEMFQRAGATFTGQVRLKDKFLDQSTTTQNFLDGLADRLRPAGMTLPSGSPYERAGAVLASALVTGTGSGGEEDTSGDAILAGFGAGDFLTTSGKPGARATLAVVVAPQQPFADDVAEPAAAALIDLAEALDAAGKGTLVVGRTEAAERGGLLAAIRGDGEAGRRISTADTADMPAGRVVGVWALMGELSGRSGHYGVGANTAGFQPTPVPTPPMPRATQQ